MAACPISRKHVDAESMIMEEPETAADETPPREAVSTSGFQSSQESCATTLAPVEDQDMLMYSNTPGSVKNPAVGVRHFVTYVFMCSSCQRGNATNLVCPFCSYYRMTCAIPENERGRKIHRHLHSSKEGTVIRSRKCSQIRANSSRMLLIGLPECK